MLAELVVERRVREPEQLRSARAASVGDVERAHELVNAGAYEQAMEFLDQALAESDGLMLESFTRPDFPEGVASFVERHVRTNLKARSAEEVERIFKLHVLPAWSNRRIQDIARRDVVELLDRMTDRGTPVADWAAPGMAEWCSVTE